MHNIIIVIFLATLNTLSVPFSLQQRYIKVNSKHQLLSPTRFNSVRKIIYSSQKSQKPVIKVTLQILCIDIARMKTNKKSHFFTCLLKYFFATMARIQWHLSPVASTILYFHLFEYSNIDDIFILALNLSLLIASSCRSTQHHAFLVFNAWVYFDQNKSVMTIKFIF